MSQFWKAGLMVFFTLICSVPVFSQSQIGITAGADLVSRYVWRGMDIGKSPAIQPTLSLNKGGFEAGIWGSYALNETASDSDEIDVWLGYTFNLKSLSFTTLVTDYYFPNSGLKFGNFNDFDDPNGAGAHTLEAGVTISSESFPVSLSAYSNFHNDAGNNTYYQLDYSTQVTDYEISLFCGFTPGSDENPDYYGADSFSVINLGVKADKQIKITEEFSVPISISFLVNPEIDQTYLIFTMSF